MSVLTECFIPPLVWQIFSRDGARCGGGDERAYYVLPLNRGAKFKVPGDIILELSVNPRCRETSVVALGLLRDGRSFTGFVGVVLEAQEDADRPSTLWLDNKNSSRSCTR